MNPKVQKAVTYVLLLALVALVVSSVLYML